MSSASPNPSRAHTAQPTTALLVAALILSSTAFCPPALAQPLYIQTVAGGGSVGDGPALTAGLNRPQDIALDAAGVLYIADYFNHRVRAANLTSGVVTVFGVVIQPGEVATVAGTGDAGFGGDGGPSTSAALNKPTGVDVDPNTGDLYIADRFNQRVRRIDATTGSISTVAGTGVIGFSGDGGPGTAADLNYPFDVAIDPATSALYVADTLNSRIRQVLSGTISTLSGTGTKSATDGPLALATFDWPTLVSFDTPTGTLLVEETTGVRVLNPTAATVSLGGLSVVPGFVGTIPLPGGTNAAVPGPVGDVYVSAKIGSSNADIRRIDPAGAVSLLAGCCANQGFSGDGGLAVSAELALPLGLALSGNILFVADSNNNRVRAVNLAPIPVTVPGVDITLVANGIDTVVGSGFSGFSGNAALAYTAAIGPLDVKTDSSGSLFVADNSNHRVAMITSATSQTAPGGTLVSVAGDGNLGFSGDGGPATLARVAFPLAVALDASGNVFVSQGGSSRRVRVVNRTAVPLTIRGVAILPGNIQTIIGPEFGDNIPCQTHVLVTEDAFGRVVYFGDCILDTIRVLNASSISRTLFGQIVPANQIATIASGLDNPADMDIDTTTGDLYAAVRFQNKVVKIDALTGAITTLAGTGAKGFGGDGGPAVDAQFDWPNGMALLPTPGDFVIADTNNNRLRTVVGGIVNTVAGTGNSAFGGDGGPAINGDLWRPWGMDVSTSGDFVVADSNNGRIRKISPPNVPVPLAAGTTIYPIPGVTMTFNSGTTNTGNVGVRASNEFPPGVTDNFDLGPSQNSPQRLLYDIDLNGVTLPPGGTVTICINYGNQFTGGQEENAIKLIHIPSNPPPPFINITCPDDGSDPECPPQDEVNNVICGKTTSFSEFFPAIEKSLSGTADLDPDVLNTKSQGNPITAYIELPAGESPSLINPATVALTAANGQAIGPLAAFDQPVAVGDGNNNGITDLKVQFSRQSLIAALQALGLTGDVTLDVRGSLTDGRSFKAPGTIEVK